MHFSLLFSLLSLHSSLLLPVAARATNVILSNDDGWAELNIREFFEALIGAPYHFNTFMSAPSENKSGTGSTDVPPTILNTTCEFNTCPIGAPAEGFNKSDPRLNYVNSFPVTSMNFGLQHLAPKFFRNSRGKPDIAVAGPNIGLNSGNTTLISGTVGATTAAALAGIPAVAFSGASGTQISYTTPSSPDTAYASIYAALSAKFTNALLEGSKKFFFQPILPKDIWINVNFSPTTPTSCSKAEDFKFIMTRINAATKDTGFDVLTCNNRGRLPTENSLLDSDGCLVTVSVGEAKTKGDVNAFTQEYARLRIEHILSCPPSQGHH